MSELCKVSGTVLLAQPIGEADKRLVIETCEYGKITAFCHGCRRPGSPLLAAANPFATGRFLIAPGRSSYRLADAQIKDYFRDLSMMQPAVYMGFYFLELIDYYGRENIDGTGMLNLLYLSLKALVNPAFEDRLVRSVFELRLIAMNGEYVPEKEGVDAPLYEICNYIVRTPLKKLYTFALSDEKREQLSRLSRKVCNKTIDQRLKSVTMLENFYE